MLKKFANNKNKAILLILQQVFAIAMTIILLILLISACVKNEDGSRSVVYIDFLENENNFQDSETFQAVFDNDIDSLAYYLAICQQFENNGSFDKNKTIDLLQYVNRKEITLGAISSNDKLVYKIGDLINWHEVDGLATINMTQSGEEAALNVGFTQIVEQYLPTDGVSLADKDLFEILYQAGIVDENCKELTNRDYYPYEETTIAEEVTEEDKTETTIEEVTEADKTEENATNAEIGLKHNYAEAKAQTIVAEYLCAAAGDLAANYKTYSDKQDYFKNNGSIKYLYIPEEENAAFYTNCSGQAKTGKKIADDFETYMERGTGSYVKYDFSADEIETHNYESNDKNHVTIRRMFHNYEYAFNGKGTLYIAYINSNEESQIFNGCDLPDNSTYVQYEQLYSQIKPYFIEYVIGAVVCAVFFVICFLLWTCMIGYTKEVTKQEEKEQVTYRLLRAEELTGFDKWYTLIAFAVANIVEWTIFGVWSIFVFGGYIDGELAIITDNSVLGGSVAFVILLVAGLQFFWASFIRRCKIHTLWKNSVIYHLYFFIKKGKAFIVSHVLGKVKSWGKRMMLIVADTNMWVRLWLPYLLFVLVNFILTWLGYHNFGGIVLVMIFDVSVGAFLTKFAKEKEVLLDGIRRIADGDITYQLKLEEMSGENVLFAQAVNRIGDGIHEAVQVSMKDERLKADLITNVSHDIKTPLTSIINYVDLLKRIDIQDEKAKEYLQILEDKSQRLKQLTLDLVEASKISSGNIVLHMESIRVKDLMMQVIGEFADKFEEKQLTMVAHFPEEAVKIRADSRRMWRVMENLFNNIYKYAMPSTRVYLDVTKKDKVWITVKNISAQELNINADELTERFIRGDVSRSTEGSGLGLSIAKSLIEAQNGNFQIVLDGDLFKVLISFEVE